jgi:hypothetical protein
MSATRFDQLVSFVNHLQAHRVPHSIAITRPDAVTVRIATPGTRWEVEFMSNDWPEAVQIERFVSSGEIAGPADLPALCEALEIPAYSRDVE